MIEECPHCGTETDGSILKMNAGLCDDCIAEAVIERNPEWTCENWPAWFDEEADEA